MERKRESVDGGGCSRVMGRSFEGKRQGKEKDACNEPDSDNALKSLQIR